MISDGNPIKLMLSFLRRKSLGMDNDSAGTLLFQKYQRFRALFEVVRREVNDQAVVTALESLFSDIEKRLKPDEKIFTYLNFASDVHKLELALVQILPTNELAYFIEAYRQDYRDLAGNEAFLTYVSIRDFWRTQGNESDTTLARAEATYLLSQTERYRALRSEVEMTREFLMRAAIRSLIQIVAPLALPVLVYVVTLTFFHPQMRDENGYLDWALTVIRLAQLGTIGIAGAFGAFLSVVNRIQGATEGPELSRNVSVLRSSEASVRLAPLIGVISASILSFLFGGTLVQGSLFPTDKGHNWMITIVDHIAFAKLMVWSFIAGFSERLVPDILDRLITRSRQERRMVIHAPEPTRAPVQQAPSPQSSQS